MKRFLTLILALALVLSLAACGGNSTSTTAAKTEAPATTEAPKTEAPVTTAEAPATTEAPKTEAPATAVPEPLVPDTEAPVTTEAPAGQDARGSYEADTYVNEYLNLKIQKPEGWIFYSEEQIAQVNNSTLELFKETDVADLIAKNGQLMDLMMSSATGSNVNLILQPNQAALKNYSDEQIFTLSEATFKAQFAAAGMDVKAYEPVEMQVGGETRTVLHITLSANGTEMEEYQIWLRPEAEYMGVLTVAIADGSDVQPILDGITKLN